MFRRYFFSFNKTFILKNVEVPLQGIKPFLERWDIIDFTATIFTYNNSAILFCMVAAILSEGTSLASPLKGSSISSAISSRLANTYKMKATTELHNNQG